jgi:sporulation protein YlmC with PRC-barrel domain
MAGIMAAGGICGASVLGPDGEALGSITELMVDTGSGAIAYAVLSFGGVLGVGEKLFAVPWACLAVDAVNDEIRLNVPRERLEALPGFDKDAWPTEADPAFAQAAVART